MIDQAHDGHDDRCKETARHDGDAEALPHAERELFRAFLSRLRELACQAVAAFPEGLFLLGLWWIRDALAAFSRGELFAIPMTRMLDRVGIVLACGSAARIFLVPGICRLLGFDAGYWIAFDAAGLVLGAIGLALKAIAGVLRHASAIQSELDEIF
ncbi:MAG TPA: hypothetical protein VE974_12555 [Thermoanaerobaculia bacterium]|nr:hypothetical protein [Thermoanaerobaculia bacterium]